MEPELSVKWYGLREKRILVFYLRLIDPFPLLLT